MHKISVVIPAKNEAATISGLVADLLKHLPGAEIIVVDDGSSDGTGACAREAGATVYTHPYSKGNGASIKAGSRQAAGDIIVFMDADGQHDPADIPRLLAYLDQDHDMVVGARQKGSQANFGRGIANKVYNKLASYMTGHKIEDLTSGFRAVRANKFREFIYLLPNGFSYPTTCTMAFFRAGYSVVYTPILAAKRKGKSHIKPFKDGIRFLLIIFKVASLYSPLKIFAPTALLFFLLGVCLYAYTYLTEHRFTNMSMLLFTTSIIIFLIGLVSEQITALLYKDHQK